jgi:predicted metal-dependent hydrolase
LRLKWQSYEDNEAMNFFGLKKPKKTISPAKQASITLPNGEVIDYQLSHRARRTIGLKITETGLIVHAPNRILAFELNRILLEKADWILQKLKARAAQTVPAIHWQSGAQLHLLGNPITLQIQILNGFAIQDLKLNGFKLPKIDFERDVLQITTSTQLSDEKIQLKVTQWYKKLALLDFTRRVEVFAAKLGVAPPPVTLSSARSRWGSCSSRGDVRLNWRLLQAPPHIINYVVCHELAHLKQMNHSPKFWAQVAQLYPDFKQAEKDLKALSPQLHRL